MQYGMYRVNKWYIRYLKKHKPWVPDPKLTNLYVGPVLTVDGKWGFYAPVTQKLNDRIFVSEDGAISGFVHVKKMIPCTDKVLKPDTKRTPESEFCLDEDNRKIIEAAAQLIYEVNKEQEKK